MSELHLGRYGCVLCDEPPPHSHDLGVVLNSRYYCPEGVFGLPAEPGEAGKHSWQPRRWRRLRPRCSRCGMKQPR